MPTRIKSLSQEEVWNRLKPLISENNGFVTDVAAPKINKTASFAGHSIRVIEYYPALVAAAENNNPAANYALAKIHFSRNAPQTPKNNLSQDTALYEKHMEKSRQLKYPPALVERSNLLGYRTDKGTSAWAAEEKKSESDLKTAAALGYAPAQAHYALVLDRQHQREKNPTKKEQLRQEALGLYKSALAQGETQVQGSRIDNLAKILERDQDHIAKKEQELRQLEQWGHQQQQKQKAQQELQTKIEQMFRQGITTQSEVDYICQNTPRLQAGEE